MGRPSKITKPVESTLRRIEADGVPLTLAALKAALAAEGIDLSVPTLCRWRRRHAVPPAPPLERAPAVHVPGWLRERLGFALGGDG